MSRLLSVDWDFFFPNPFAGAKTSLDHFLYDWGHSENDPISASSWIWSTRAESFLCSGMALPRCINWENFWSRFNLKPRAKLYFADSHVQALNADVAFEGKFDEVWNFDAHHDLGYSRSDAIGARDGNYTCANWLQFYIASRAEVHIVLPEWNEDWERHCPKTKSKRVNCLRDDGKQVKPAFDAVFVARSGAWTPPWCDDDFTTFINSARLETWDIQELCYGSSMKKREFDLEAVTASAALRTEAFKTLRGYHG